MKHEPELKCTRTANRGSASPRPSHQVSSLGTPNMCIEYRYTVRQDVCTPLICRLSAIIYNVHGGITDLISNFE